MKSKTPEKKQKLDRHLTPMPKRVEEHEVESNYTEPEEHTHQKVNKSKVRFSGSLDFQVFKKNSSPNSLKQHSRLVTHKPHKKLVGKWRGAHATAHSRTSS